MSSRDMQQHMSLCASDCFPLTLKSLYFSWMGGVLWDIALHTSTSSAWQPQPLLFTWVHLYFIFVNLFSRLWTLDVIFCLFRPNQSLLFLYQTVATWNLELRTGACVTDIPTFTCSLHVIREKNNYRQAMISQLFGKTWNLSGVINLCFRQH